MIKIFVAIPTTGTVVDTLPHVLRLIEARYKDKVELVYPEAIVRRIFHDFAREAMVDEFLKTDCDVLWFIDSDVVPPVSCLDAYIKAYEEWDCAAMPYPVFINAPGETAPQVVYTIYKGRGSKGYAMAQLPLAGIDYVDGAGTGAMLIKRHVLEKIEAPRFEFKYDEKTRRMTIGEDLGFCIKVNQLGYHFFIDYSAVCSHHKTINLLDAGDYAREYAKRSVETYAESIKSQIEAFAARQKSQAFKNKILNVNGSR